jgi:hypothetical protein
MMKYLIGISGKFGSGKDTIGSFIKEENPNVTLLSFGISLKDYVALLCNINIDILLSQEGKKEIGKYDKIKDYSMLKDGLNNIFGNLISPDQWNLLLEENYKIIDGKRSWGEILQITGKKNKSLFLFI